MNEKEIKISQVNLKEIRHNVRYAINQDGMDTLSMGIVFVVFPLLGILDRFTGINDFMIYTIFFSLLAISRLLPIIFRKKITYKRVGYYKPQTKIMLSIVLIILAFFLLIFGRSQIWNIAGREYFDSIKPIYFGLWFAFFTFIYTYFSGYKMKTGIMFSMLILLISCSAMLFSIEDRDLAYNCVYFIIALIMISVGIIQAFRFLKKYPKQAEELNYDD